jgi:hypothetical protein
MSECNWDTRNDHLMLMITVCIKRTCRLKSDIRETTLIATTLNPAFKVTGTGDCILISDPKVKSSGKETSGTFNSSFYEGSC